MYCQNKTATENDDEGQSGGSLPAKSAPTLSPLDAERFFKTLYANCQGKIEIRAVNSNSHEPIQYWPGSSAEAVKIAMEIAGDWNVYVGVATRKQKRGKKVDVFEFPGVWVDLDFKDFPGR